MAIPMIEFNPGTGGTGGGGIDLAAGGNNTTGTLSTIAAGTAVLNGGNNITLSQNASNITIYDGMNTNSFTWLNGQVMARALTSLSSSMYIWPNPVQGFISGSRVNAFVSMSLSSSATAASTGSGSINFTVQVFTRTGSTLSNASSAAQTYTWSYTSNGNTSWAQMMQLSAPLNAYFTPGDYWMGCVVGTTSGGNLGATVSWLAGAHAAQNFAIWGAGTNVSAQLMPGLGLIATTGSIVSFPFSSISGSGVSSQSFPILNFVNFTA